MKNKINEIKVLIEETKLVCNYYSNILFLLKSTFDKDLDRTEYYTKFTDTLKTDELKGLWDIIRKKIIVENYKIFSKANNVNFKKRLREIISKLSK